MTQILIAYAVAVVLNRAFNLCWWCATKRSTPRAYYREHGFALLATLLLHVPAFVLWLWGPGLAVVNAVVKGTLAVPALIPGVDLSSIQLPAEVTPAVTLVYGWPFDSIVSRAGMLLGSRFALFGGNGAAKEKAP